MFCGPLEPIPPILRLEETLLTGGIGDGGCLGGLELVVGEVDGIGQERGFLYCISYELAGLRQECERACQ